MTSATGLLLLLALGVAFIVVATVRYRLHPFLSLLVAAAALGLAAGLPAAQVVAALTGGFGRTVGVIGIVIACGAIIGTTLERSGGAGVLAAAVARGFGARRAAGAMSGTGAIVAVPVFCDSGFVLLAPLARGLARNAGQSVAAVTGALAMGLYATHCLVPPTPGPVAAAAALSAPLGAVILLGAVVVVPVLFTTCAYARFAARKIGGPAAAAEPAAAGHADGEDPPGLAAALTPIALPASLIALRALSGLPGSPFAALRPLLEFTGEPVVALALGVVAAGALLVRGPDRTAVFSGWCGEGLRAAGSIILVTAAGGALGGVLRETPLAAALGGWLSEPSGGWRWLLPFLLAAMLKTALGSSTVAMITAASLVAPLLPVLGLDAGYGPALATLALAAGGMALSHVNDSYFWVVTQFTGLSVAQGFRLVTVASGVAALTALAAVWLLGLVLH